MEKDGLEHETNQDDPDHDMLQAALAAAPARVSRRRFLAGAAALGVGAALPIVAGCIPSGGTTTTTGEKKEKKEEEKATTTTVSGPTNEEMDRAAEEKVKAFPAETKGLGGQPLQPRIEKGVKVFELTAQEVDWEVEKGKTVRAMSYNGVVPGPEIRIKQGDKIRVIFKNQLKESTSVHWHGVRVPNVQDGVPYITQKPVKPGATFTYEFTAVNPGSHMYHSHHNAAVQVPGGLLGPFIIEPKNPKYYPIAAKVDVDHTIVINDGPLGFTFNGKSFPATKPIVAEQGQKIRIRFMNEGLMDHPMHLHGLIMQVFARDGWPLPAPFRCDTINVAPGERYDVLVDADAKGTWALHCHILTHAETPMGMFGMVTAVIVQ